MAKIFKILAIIYFNAYPIRSPAVVGNASERCSLVGNAVVGNASKRSWTSQAAEPSGNQWSVTLGGVTYYTVTLGGVTHYGLSASEVTAANGELSTN